MKRDAFWLEISVDIFVVCVTFAFGYVCWSWCWWLSILCWAVTAIICVLLVYNIYMYMFYSRKK